MKRMKKTISLLLALMILLSLAGLSVYADGEEETNTPPITNTVTIGANENGTSVNAAGTNVLADADAKTGTITVGGDKSGSNSLPASVTDVTVEVVKDVAANDVYNAVRVTGSDNANAPQTTVKLQDVSLNFSASGTVTTALYGEGSNITVNAEDVKATSSSTDKATVGINAQHGAEVTAGEVSAEGVASAIGVAAINGAEITAASATATSKNGEATAINVSSGESGAESKVTVTGSATATSENENRKARAVNVTANQTDTKSEVTVKGDAESSDIGVNVTARDGGKADVLIEGTLSGETPVLVSDTVTEDNLSLTVWKIETDEHKEPEQIVSYTNNTQPAAANAFTDQSIQYIIKVTDPGEEKGALNAAGENGNQSHGYNVAAEGEKVTLKITVKDGYVLDGVFNNNLAIKTQDGNGNYYIEVPKGGGVSLSVLLNKIQNADSNSGGEPAKQSEASPVSVSVVENIGSQDLLKFNREVVRRIEEAPENGTVSVDAGTLNGLMRMVFRALRERTDVTLEVLYTAGEQRCALTIPAGMNPIEKIGPMELVVFENFPKLLGISPTTI